MNMKGFLAGEMLAICSRLSMNKMPHRNGNLETQIQQCVKYANFTYLHLLALNDSRLFFSLSLSPYQFIHVEWLRLLYL